MALNQFNPPARAFFTPFQGRGEADLGVDIGGFGFHLAGLDAALRDRLAARYHAFLQPAAAAFQVGLLDAQRDCFVSSEQISPGDPHPLSIAWEGSLLLLQSFGFAGWMDVENLRGELALGRKEFERGELCVENYLRVCTAWRAVHEGGVLLHGASLTREGKGYIFVGASGSGKSTLAETSKAGEVVSDDLTLVRRMGGTYALAGTPFRGTYTRGRPILGSFPIAGIFRIFKAAHNRREECPRNHAVADLLAAAPFVVDQLARAPRILSILKSLDDAHPLSYLHFNLNGDFWEVLDGK